MIFPQGHNLNKMNRTLPFLILVILLSKDCNERPPHTGAIESSFFNIDTTSSGIQAPLMNGKPSWSGAAWRGERVSDQLHVWTTGSGKEINISASVLTGIGGLFQDFEKISIIRASELLFEGKPLLDLLAR